MKFYVLLVLIISFVSYTTSENGLPYISDLEEKVISTFNLQWQSVPHSKDLQPDVALTRILRRLYHLRLSIESFEKQLVASGGIRDLSELHTTLTHLGISGNLEKWAEAWSYMESRTGPINSLFSSLIKQQNQTQNASLTSRALLDFAETIHNEKGPSMEDFLRNLHFITTDQEGVFWQFYYGYQKQLMCSLHQSPHQLLYNLYNFISLTEIKGYTMMHFSWMTLQLHKKGNYSTEVELARNALLERSAEKKKAAEDVLHELTSEFWKCDPSKQIEDSTYYQITELLQGFVENEVDMNSQNTCRQNCGYYNYATHEGCYKDGICNQQRQCKGKVTNCQFIDADSTVCLSSQQHRRYDWIEYENGRQLGTKNQCPNSLTVDSWWRWLFWHCSFCFCICDDDGPTSDRYFDLREVTSNIEKNKIVTGVRFIKTQRFISIQIQQGIALSRGGVNDSTVSWEPIQEMDISSRSFIEGKDYTKLSFEKRGIDLDDIVGSDGTVVTGVRFRQLGTNLNLEVQFTPMDFKTGKLNAANSHWKSNDQTPASEKNARQKFTLSNLDVPTKANTKSMPDSKNGEYLEFTHTSLNKDVAQTTIPFIDAQEVVVSPSSWLNGLGVFHKGQGGYGGYIALKVFTHNFTNYLEATNPSEIPHLSTILQEVEDSTSPSMVAITQPPKKTSKENEI